MLYHYKDGAPAILGIGVRSALDRLLHHEEGEAVIVEKKDTILFLPATSNPGGEVFTPPFPNVEVPGTILKIRVRDPIEGEIEAQVELFRLDGEKYLPGDRIPVTYSISRKFGDINAQLPDHP